MEWLADRLSDYIDGLYLLDPYYQKAVAEESGFHRLTDISPEDYFISEYHDHFYQHTNIVEETRFIVPLDQGGSLQVLVARAGDDVKFQDIELDLLRAFHPLVSEYCRFHLAQAGRHYGASPQGADSFDLRDKIAALPGAQLTAREIDTVELMLKGHSTKSVARLLNIDDGTVSNHKRNIYQKLDIHSQAQLFNLFLESLTG
nr:LuxR C-terminal-related transcriptional regulator [Sphingomonas colocasiae]